MDADERLLAIAEAAVARELSRVTRHQAVHLRTLSVLTRWGSEVVREEARRVAAVERPPRGGGGAASHLPGMSPP